MKSERIQNSCVFFLVYIKVSDSSVTGSGTHVLHFFLIISLTKELLLCMHMDNMTHVCIHVPIPVESLARKCT